MTNNQKIAGFFRQILIISWKNLILSMRNKIGIICEVVFSCLFTLVFILLVYYSSPKYESKTNFFESSPINIIFTPDLQNATDYYFYPDNQFTREIIKNSHDIINKMSFFRKINLIGSNISNPDYLDESKRNKLFAFVSFSSQFDSIQSISDTIQYIIYTKESSIIQSYKTSEKWPPKKDYLYHNSPEYICQNEDYNYKLKYDAFVTIKHSIDLSLIKKLTNVEIGPDLIKIAKLNCPGYINDILKSTLTFMTPVLISLSFLVTFLVTVSSIITEKETKMKEYLRLVGVNPVVIWFCWMMRSFIIYLIISIVVTVTSTLKFELRVKNEFMDKKSLFLNTNSFIVFWTCIIYSIQCTCLSLLVGQIFSKPFAAKTISIIFWFITLINFYDSFSVLKYIFSIFPNSALNFAIQVIFQYERSGKKLDFENLYKNLFNDSLNLGALLASMLLWSIFYLILSWYIERILPGEYGIKQPWYFPFMKSYWIENKSNDYFSSNSGINLNDDNFDSEAFEREPIDLFASVKIKNLTKKFTSGFEEKTVVDNISLNFFENQITGFLGHNGAGKTTVTFILCGLYSPDSGTAQILGHDIKTHMNKIRTSIGFCPQNNILYDELTVYQHLDLIASIKGYSRNQIKKEILRISRYVGLHNDLEKLSKQLSGGMKRRLSVAMALIGDSKIIILDEPTSGLDPFNRRSLWEIIRNYKQGRTIIISTHYMEEADALSDRIALMNHGKIKCCGSPLFLKDKFGSGYRLTLTKDQNFNLKELENMVKAVLGIDAIVQSNIAGEICLSVPNDFNSKLPVLLTNLENFKSRFGILNYGVSSATVEEVFLKIGSIDINEDIFKKDNRNLTESITNQNLTNAFDENGTSPDDKNRGLKFYLQQIKSLITKRYRIFTRRYIILIFTLLIPVLIETLLASLIPSTSSLITDTFDYAFGRSFIPPFNLDVTSFGKQKFIYDIIENKPSNIKEKFLAYFEKRKHSDSQINFINSNPYDLDDYMFEKRKSEPKNIVKEYFFGIKLILNDNLELNSITGFYSTYIYHSSATILNEINSFLLAYYSNNLNKSIKCINSPISVGRNASLPSTVDLSKLDLLSCIEIIPFSFLDYINSIIIAFVISVSTIHLTREKRNGSKNLQLLSGTHYAIYWLSNFIFDSLIYFIQITLICIVLKLVSLTKNDSANDTFIIAHKNSTLFYLFLFMILTSFSWSILSYIWSNFFKSDIVGFIVLFILLSFATFVDMICVLLGFFDASLFNQVGTLGSITNMIRNTFVILFPNVALKRAIFNLKLQNTPLCIETINMIFSNKLKKSSKGFDISEPGIGKFALMNLILFFVGLFILFLIEDKTIQNYIQSLLHKRHVTPIENLELETDVKNESERIKKSNILAKAKHEEPLVVSDLCKIFKKSGRPFSAVNHLSFGVLPTECFGLLGLNGAGKTTTIEILTGEKDATSGLAYLNGYNIKNEKLKAIRSLGFCPQFDYLPEFLTVKQTLELFANLRGLKEFKIKAIVREFIDAFKLNEFKNKLVQNLSLFLSGGNKRKVSSAIAFIGKPKIVILDEPTSGMDPAARRYLWNIIKHARDNGMTVLLTTHSMEECEALCTKLGIMVNGQFQCFGNIQNLKSKYGKGYSLILKCKLSPNSSPTFIENLTKNVENFVQENIPNAVLKDKQQNTLFFQIIFENDNRLTIANIFNLIETNKENLNLETYSLSQTTLEQVFLTFARKQIDSSFQSNDSQSLRRKFFSNHSYVNKSFNQNKQPEELMLKDL